VADTAARVIVVPEADSDAGRELARAAAELADAVMLCGVDQARLGALGADLQDTHGSRVAIFCGDVRIEADRAAMREMLEELFGPR
jgi:short-subunit dehydrogenase